MKARQISKSGSLNSEYLLKKHQEWRKNSDHSQRLFHWFDEQNFE